MDKHIVKSFDQELANLNAMVLRMGGVVEEQIGRAMTALRDQDLAASREVISRDHLVNFMEVQADETIVSLLALRQPMGRDLRMVMSLGKTVSDLERIGDEAGRIARMTIQLHEASGPTPRRQLFQDAFGMAVMATAMIQDALDALARLDVVQALEVTRRDAELDQAFHCALRRLATYVIEDPRNVGRTIDVTFILRSIERIGDHAKNIAEYVVYLVKGKDVRHVSPEGRDEDVLTPGAGP